MALRFRSFLPIAIDVETGGTDPRRHPLLEIAMVIIGMEEDGSLEVRETVAFPVSPFDGAELDASALAINGIDPTDNSRGARDELEVLSELFSIVRRALRTERCSRAVLVGHNAHFDHKFMLAAVERAGVKRNPFHPFSVFDTATLGGLAVGQTVLARACAALNLAFDERAAHSADYDAQRSATLFCHIANQWHQAYGVPQQCAPSDHV